MIGILKHTPCHIKCLPFKIIVTRKGFKTDPEVECLAAALTPDLLAFLILVGCCGLRRIQGFIPVMSQG